MAIKKRVRSPRYPSFSVEDAVASARKIYEKDGMNAVDRESAVRHMGYSSLNGASATALASLKQYGLAVDEGKGTIRLTDLALDLLEPESDQRFSEAAFEAAFSPDLFQSLREKFPATVPSESNLRAHLVRQEFTQAAIKSVVPAYLATCEYIEELGVSESYRGEVSTAVEMVENVSDRGAPMINMKQSEPDIPVTPSISQPVTHGRRMVLDTDEGEVIITYPENLSTHSVEDVEEWLALVTKRLRRSVS